MSNSHIVQIRPRKGVRVAGHFKHHGTIIGANRTVYPKQKNPFSINGDGITYDKATPDGAILHDKLTGPTLYKKLFVPSNKFTCRFEMIDQAQRVTSELDAHEMKADMFTRVKALKPMELRTMGRYFGLGTDDRTIKAALYKVVETDFKNIRNKVRAYLNSPDRKILEIITHGLSIGNKGEKTGLYLNDNKIYFYGNSVIGANEEDVVAFLKSESKEEGRQAYMILKELHDKEVARLEQEEKNKEAGTASSTPTITVQTGKK